MCAEYFCWAYFRFGTISMVYELGLFHFASVNAGTS